MANPGSGIPEPVFLKDPPFFFFSGCASLHLLSEEEKKNLSSCYETILEKLTDDSVEGFHTTAVEFLKEQSGRRPSYFTLIRNVHDIY